MRILHDALGRRLELVPAPERIVSLVPSLTELLFSLEVGERIVGVSDYCLFPEAEVAVRRMPGLRRLRTPDLALGDAHLGEGRTMGGVTDLPVGGIEVSLISDEDDERDAAVWIAEAQRRLKDELLPLLHAQDPYLYLKVQLVLRRKIEEARLTRDRYVGVNRLRAPGSEKAAREQLVLFQGEVRAGLASEHMNFALPSRQRGR